MRKQCIGKGIWSLGEKKRKQKSKFFGALAAQVGAQLVSGLVNKIFGGRRKRKGKFRKKRTRRLYYQ